MTDQTSTVTSPNLQHKKSIAAEKSSSEVYARDRNVTDLVAARRNAVWKGRKVVLETRHAEKRITHSIGHLGIQTSGVAVIIMHDLKDQLLRWKEDTGVLKDKVVVDLCEARWDSNEKLGERLGLSETSVSDAISWLCKRDFLRSTGKQGKRQREIAFGGAFIDRVTGVEHSVKPTNNSPIKRLKKKSSAKKTDVHPKIKPSEGFFKNPSEGLLGSKDLGSQEIQKTKQNTACSMPLFDCLDSKTEEQNSALTSCSASRQVAETPAMKRRSKRKASRKVHYDFVDADGRGEFAADRVASEKKENESKKLSRKEAENRKREEILKEAQASIPEDCRIEVRAILDAQVRESTIKARSFVLRAIYLLYSGNRVAYINTLKKFNLTAFSWADIVDGIDDFRDMFNKTYLETLKEMFDGNGALNLQEQAESAD